MDQERQVTHELKHQIPVWFLDANRRVERANLLVLWVFGLLELDQPFDPHAALGRHMYEHLARAIKTGRLPLEVPDNFFYLRARLLAVLGQPEERLPEVQEFLRLVFASGQGEEWWRGQVTGYASFVNPIEQRRYHNQLVLTPPGERLDFTVKVTHFGDGGPRLLSYSSRGATAALVKKLYARIKHDRPDLTYVQDVRQLTASDQEVDQTPDTSFRHMPSSEREPVSPSQEVSDRTRVDLWRPGEEFGPQPLVDVFDQQRPDQIEHPVDGRGYAWDLPTCTGTPTRLELYPEHRVAKLRFVDTTNEPQNRAYLLDYLAVEHTEEGPRVAIASVRERRASLLRVYPSGEFDEYLRFTPPGTSDLPPEGVIWQADVPRQSGEPAPKGEQPRELTVVEAAERLGMSRSAVTRLAQQGRLRGRQVANRKWLLNLEDVASYQRSNAGRKPRHSVRALHPTRD